MAAKITYSAVLPDGKVVTRKSTRTYSHAVAVLHGMSREEAKWTVYSFNGRQDLAIKEANKLRNTVGQVWVSGGIDFEVQVVSVVNETAKLAREARKSEQQAQRDAIAASESLSVDWS